MADVLSGGGGDGPRLVERWHSLTRRVRYLAAGLALGCVTVGAAAYVVLAEPGREAPPAEAARRDAPHKVPYPVHSTRITFVRVFDIDAQRRSFRIELRAVTKHLVLVRRVTQQYEALTMELSPPQAVTVRPGQARRVRVTARVTSCRDLPVRARLPFLDVTLRNARASQDLSFIPGDRYARALTRVFRTVCGPASRS
ncbi:hypothetical protein ACH4RA_15775 [Streptomyces smyrnaeus]|uniref:hypothetical protein n=1 Tax=Streptomyces TaxID=1883 RepID=UPI001B39AC65|nr:hypothetical protein [Streptomyces sp. RK75]MBQ0864936.1 hypothetical protein [Streptomyces sp. RK75]MBQ1158810.1 hypothetical protein [Streptomyces sp. A73]